MTSVQCGAVGSRCLVTGGSGFIGRYLVSALIARGHCVRVYDCAQPGGWSPDVEFVRGSILDRAGVMRALDGIDCVYHLGAIAHLWRLHTGDFDAVNHCGTEIVLTAAADRRIRRFIHCSTETVLLPRRGTGAEVDEAVCPGLSDMAGPYTRSKYLAEQAALSAAGRGLPVVIVNPTLPIGSGDRDFTPPTAMIALYLLTSSPFFLDCLLNLVDVRDVANGMILAAERGRVGERYILGGENIWLRQIVSMLGHMTGRRGRKLSVPAPLALAAGCVSEWISNTFTHRMPTATAEGVRLALRSVPLDNSKARRELDYAPRPVEQALTDAAAWILANIAPDAPANSVRLMGASALGRRRPAFSAASRVTTESPLVYRGIVQSPTTNK